MTATRTTTQCQEQPSFAGAERMTLRASLIAVSMGFLSVMAGCGGSVDTSNVVPPSAGRLLSAVQLPADLPVFTGQFVRNNKYSTGGPTARFGAPGDAVLLRRNDGQLWQLTISTPNGPRSDDPYSVGLVSGREDNAQFRWNSPDLEIRVPGYADFRIAYPQDGTPERTYSVFETIREDPSRTSLSLTAVFDLHPSVRAVPLAELVGEWKALTTEREDHWLQLTVGPDGNFLLSDATTGACQSAGVLRSRGNQLLDVELRKPCDSTEVTATGLATLSDSRSYGSGVSFYVAVTPKASVGGIPFGLVAQRRLPEYICDDRPSAC